MELFCHTIGVDRRYALRVPLDADMRSSRIMPRSICAKMWIVSSASRAVWTRGRTKKRRKCLIHRRPESAGRGVRRQDGV